MFDHDVYVAVATHDDFLVNNASDEIKARNLSREAYEFQMLYGVTPHLRDKLLSEGHRLRLYVPFGKDWFGYCSRRIKENPKMAGDIIKAIFIRG